MIRVCRNFHRDYPGTLKAPAWPDWDGIRARLVTEGIDRLKALYQQHGRLHFMPTDDELRAAVLRNQPTELERELAERQKKESK